LILWKVNFLWTWKIPDKVLQILNLLHQSPGANKSHITRTPVASTGQQK
jgi:hypothetical protein